MNPVITTFPAPSVAIEFDLSKYDSDGEVEWISHYYPEVNQFAVGNSIKLFQRDCPGDAACWVWDVYVTGYVTGTNTDQDIITIKYDPSGTEKWAVTYDGSESRDDRGNSIGVDAEGNAYVTGYTTETPISETNTDYVTLFYKSSDGSQFREPITENGGGDGE